MQLRLDKELLLVLPCTQRQDKGQAFTNHLLKHRNMASVSIFNWNAGERYTAYSQMSDLEDRSKQLRFAFVNSDLDLYVQFKKNSGGRSLSLAYLTDNQHIDSLAEKHSRKLSESECMILHSAKSIIVTQKLAQQLHLKKPVIGQVLKMSVIAGTIVAVIQDSQGLSLRE